MEKLTEKMNSFKITKKMKNDLIKIAENEQLYIHQVCRKLLALAIKKHIEDTLKN